jgi:hypothetical protein
LDDYAREMLSAAIGMDYSQVDFSNDEFWFCCTIYNGMWRPVVVIAFEFKTDFDPHASVAVTDPRGLTRQVLTTIFQTVFSRADRITALIEPSNTRALGQIWRFGFKPEGLLRRGLDGKKDAAVFGLLPEECPYLRGSPFTIRVVRPTHQAHMGVQ